jgi:hypothetical protein
MAPGVDDATEALARYEVPRAKLTQPLAAIGFEPRDVVAVEDDAGTTTHYEIAAMERE